MQVGRHKSRLWTNTWLSITDWLSANNKCDGDRAVYRTDGDTSVNLCLSQPAARTTTTKRTQQNLLIRSDKSEVEVTHNRRTNCTIESRY